MQCAFADKYGQRSRCSRNVTVSIYNVVGECFTHCSRFRDLHIILERIGVLAVCRYGQTSVSTIKRNRIVFTVKYLSCIIKGNTVDNRIAIGTLFIITKEITLCLPVCFKLKAIGMGHGDTVFYSNGQ